MPATATSSVSYFRQHRGDVCLTAEGLRRGQVAAVHALMGHLHLKTEPAIAVLPTGAGKTDVAILLPYLLAAERVLFVVPSDSVRSQVAQRSESLALLKALGVLPQSLPGPKVKKLSKRISTAEEWDELRGFDVVVTVPSSISPAHKGVLQPPENLFDLLIIDEAHHSPAKTWQAVLEAFPQAKRVLFTATPFRRDRKQIKGAIAVNYSLRQARADQVFGDINYRPLIISPGEDPDVAIAQAAESALKVDRTMGLKHSILVRAASVPHANELLEKYNAHTKLKLEVVHSHFSAKRVDKAIKQLLKRELDGVICVNMLGEGFDCPNLKIAALHAPHASLGVTLQFIGRFARVKDGSLGAAQFFAVPSEIEGEMEILFRHEAVWQDLIVNLAEARVLAEDRTRSALATFQTPSVHDTDLEELSLYALRPMYHAKVYRVPEDTDLDMSKDITIPKPFEIVHRQVSEELETAVIVAREQQRPKWSDQARFRRIEYELFVVYYAKEGRFLFISSSRRADSLYRSIAAEYVGYTPKGLPLYLVNRILVGLTKIECFSVGMKNRLHVSRQESYRMLAGRNAHQAIRQADGRLFHQGHIYCTALDPTGKSILLGYSSGSKIWSGGKGTIPEIVEWCSSLARKMLASTGTITAPGLDILEVGVPLASIPEDAFAVDWESNVYEDGIEAKVEGADDEVVLLADFSLRIDRSRSSAQQIRVVMEHGDDRWSFDFAPDRAAFFTLVSGQTFDVVYGHDELPIEDFLNEYPLYFYCASFAKFRGEEHFPCRIAFEAFDRSTIQCVDWDTANVAITKEYWKAGAKKNGQVSVHEYLESALDRQENDIVLYDHRSGEIADYVTVASQSDRLVLTLYHCKGSGSEKPGGRVDDVYEVCGQVVKSFHLISEDKRLLRHVKRRCTKGKIQSRFVRGKLEQFEKLIRDRGSKQIEFRFVVVQPGISQSEIKEEGLSVLAAANEFVHSVGAQDLVVMGSK